MKRIACKMNLWVRIIGCLASAALAGCVMANDGHCENCRLVVELLALEDFPAEMDPDALSGGDWPDDGLDGDDDADGGFYCALMESCACPASGDAEACAELVAESTEDECQQALSILYPSCLPQAID